VYEDVPQRTEPSYRTWRRDPVRASRFRRRETEERRGHHLDAPRLRHHGDSRDAKSPKRRALSPDIFTRPESLSFTEGPARSNFVLPELLKGDDLDDVTSSSSDDEDEVISRLSSAGSFARGRLSTHHARSRSAKSSHQHEEVGESGGRYDSRPYRHRRISSWNYPSSNKDEPSTGRGRGRRNAVERKERLARIFNSDASDSESDSEEFGNVMTFLRPSKSHHRSASHEFCDDDQADRTTQGRGRNGRRRGGHRRALTSVQDLLASLAESGDYREVY